MEIIEALKWRYATKEFDPNRKISDQDLEKFLESLVLTPSSFGLQPWKFIVLENPETRAALVEHSWGQKQVVEASHLIIFLSKKEMEMADIDKYLAKIIETRKVPDPSILDGYRDMMVGNIINGSRSKEQIATWARMQAYIALGQAMTVAAVMGIDACPMEGFVPAEYDRILGLEDTQYTSTLVLPIGYRSENDRYASLAKVRFDKEDMIEIRK